MTGAGEYLRRCREQAGLSLDDVALMTETDPPVSAARRAEWLGQMERGELPVCDDVVAALAAVPGYRFDAHALAGLVTVGDADAPTPLAALGERG